MSTGSAAAVSFPLLKPTPSAAPTINVELREPQVIELDMRMLEALEDFEDVTDAHKAFTDPRNSTPVPWSKVKRSLKL